MLMMKTLGAIVEALFTKSVCPRSSLLCSTGEVSAIGVESDCCDNERIESAEAQRPFENLIVGDSVRRRVIRCKEVRESRLASFTGLSCWRICKMRLEDK